MRLDGRVLAFTAAISVLTGIGFGLAPAMRAARSNVRSDGRLMSRKFLVGAQVAMCLLLLICAGLLQRTLLKLEGVDLGFEREHLVQFTVRPGLNGYKDPRLVGYYNELQSRLDARPFVRSSTLSLRPAVGGGSAFSRATIAGITKPDERITIFRHQVGSRYFRSQPVRSRDDGDGDFGGARRYDSGRLYSCTPRLAGGRDGGASLRVAGVRNSGRSPAW
jgi:hypothetical protein